MPLLQTVALGFSIALGGPFIFDPSWQRCAALVVALLLLAYSAFLDRARLQNNDALEARLKKLQNDIESVKLRQGFNG